MMHEYGLSDTLAHFNLIRRISKVYQQDHPLPTVIRIYCTGTVEHGNAVFKR